MKPDFFDDPEADERNDEDGATCTRCGKSGLEWVDIGIGRWRLYEGKKLHVCESQKPDASDFKPIEDSKK